MLVLTRKLGESIVIGDNIKVKIISVAGTQVKIGIEAPPGITVHREEVFMKIKEENILASTIDVNINELESFFKNRSK